MFPRPRGSPLAQSKLRPEPGPGGRVRPFQTAIMMHSEPTTAHVANLTLSLTVSSTSKR